MNKPTKQRFQNEISFSLFDGMEWGKKIRNEGDLISFHPIFWADYECSLQDQLHLESENGIEMEMKMKNTCCLDISSVVK